jgi:hypothetical protein
VKNDRWLSLKYQSNHSRIKRGKKIFYIYELIRFFLLVTETDDISNNSNSDNISQEPKIATAILHDKQSEFTVIMIL